MNFLLKNRILLLFSAAALILAAALFWPEAKKAGEMQKYYSIPQGQLTGIEYSGEMQLGDKNKARAEYQILREENPLKPKEPLYHVEIRSLTAGDNKTAKRVAELKQLKSFYTSALVKTIIQDWAELDYFYILKHEPDRDAEYGLKDCKNRLTLTFRSGKKEFCIGAASQGDTRRYLLDVEKDKVLITPDYTVRRIVNNIFAQREQSLHPYGSDGVDTIELRIEAASLKKLPLLAEKTGGNLKLRMLVKDDPKGNIHVWHADGLLSIKPSHAAEFAQLLQALRVNAPFATDAVSPEKPIADAIKLAGIDLRSAPGLSGELKVKKTDKQDVLLTRFAFYPPGTRSLPQPAWQFENQISRAQDTLLVSHFNAGYISGDLYPRLFTVLAKFEADMAEAQKKGEQEKNERQKKEKAAQNPDKPKK